MTASFCSSMCSLMKMVVTVTVIVLVCKVTSSHSTDPVLGSVSPDAVGNAVDDSSKITFAPIPQGDPYKATSEYDDGGMGPLFDFARSFVNTCFPKGFPYDLIEKVQSGNLDIASDAQGIVMAYLGYAAAIVVGLLFILIFPIVGLCFCCCRCCGNCGGKRHQKGSSSASCKRKVFAIILLLLVVMAGVGTICTFVSNDRMSTALNKFGDTAVDNIGDVSIFLNNTVQQVQRVAKDNFDFTQNVIFRDLDSMGYLVGIPVRQSLALGGTIDNTFNTALALQAVLDDATSKLNTVFDEIEHVKTNATQLASDLTDVKNKIDAACANPTDCGGSAPDTSALAMGFNASTLPDFSGEKAQLDSVQSQNLTKTILEAKVTFDTIPEKVQNDTESTVQNLKTMVSDYTQQVDPMINMTNSFKDQALGSIDFNSLEKQITSVSKDVATYDKYRWYAGIGLTSLLVLIVLLLFIGLGFGVFGSSASDIPTDRGCLSNSGGNMLMAAVGFVFIFSPLLMLLTTLTFMLGAPIEKFVCQPLSDPELTIFTKLIDEMDLIGGGTNGSFLGNALFQDPSVDLTIASIFKDCRSGKPAYTAFKLDNFKSFNITALTDYSSSIDIDGQLNAINVDLSTLEILTPSIQSQLSDFESAVTGIDFTKFDELKQNTTAGSLSDTAANLRTVAAGVADPAKTQLEEAADDIDAIIAGPLASTSSAQNALLASSSTLNTTFSTIPDSIKAVTDALNTTQEFLRNNGSDTVKAEAKTFATRLTGIVDSFIEDAVDALQDEIGQCTPIYNIYSSLLLNGFCKYMVDALNGFWFSLGWCIFFFVPSLVFAVKLAKHYRTMKTADVFSDVLPNKPGASVSPSAGPMFGNNKVAHDDKW